MSKTFINDHDRTSTSNQLRRQMKIWREALDRTTIPGLVGKKRFVTQEEVAVLCGLAFSHYGNLERGRTGHYSDDVLDTVAQVLRLGDVSRRVLYLLAVGREPRPGPHPTPRITTAVQARLGCQPWPAYILDPQFNIVAYNDATLQWFPYVQTERNVLRAVTCLPQVRLQLLDWETVWLPRAVAQLKGQLAWPGHDRGLDRLAAEIVNSCPQARHWMYNDAKVWMYEDGDARQLLMPGRSDSTTIVMSSDTSASNPGMRQISILPVGGYMPPNCRPFLHVGT